MFLAGCCFPPVGGSSQAPPALPPLPGTTPAPPAAPGLIPLSPGAAAPVYDGCGFDRRIEQRAAAGEIPRVAAAFELFGDLQGRAEDPLTGGVLICDLRLPGTAWPRSRPDMQAKVRLGDGKEVLLVGDNNRDETVVTMPIDQLASGDSISIVVEDRDLFNRPDHLDSAQGSYGGTLPLLLSGGGRKLHVICQHLSAAEVAGRMQDLVGDATAALDAYDAGAAVDRGGDDWGFPWTERHHAEVATEQVAAHVGWSDAAVTTMRRRLRDIRRRFEQAAAGDVTSVLSAAPAPGSPVAAPGGRVSVTVGAVGCGTAAAGLLSSVGASPEYPPHCVAEVHLQATVSEAQMALGAGSEPILPGGATPDIVLADGRTGPLHLVAATLNGALLPDGPARFGPGDRLTLLVASGGGCAGAAPTLDTADLVRLTARNPAFARLR